ncbi:hypothetical protein [Candidatus Pantoea soli]|uniref:hypothetical protein n=1 Tax=Candidatus Pantoea soli TaxID=3098669 RepID=UPI00119D1A39|nr:hypothetical protein [Pantoea soli]
MAPEKVACLRACVARFTIFPALFKNPASQPMLFIEIFLFVIGVNLETVMKNALMSSLKSTQQASPVIQPDQGAQPTGRQRSGGGRIVNPGILIKSGL